MSGHGWRPLGTTADGAAVSFAPIVDERVRCDCSRGRISWCNKRATQEDGLCDECRTECRR